MSEPALDNPLVVTLSIPCRAEYVGVARLAILGIASRLNFSYDEVEDLRLAVGEACTGAIDRVGDAADAVINLRCDILPSTLRILVNYKGAPTVAPAPEENGDPENIGALLMEILVDSVEIHEDLSGDTTILLTKTVAAP